MSQSANYDKFRSLLRELFMFDRADLDFGIYRIMNAKRDEIERFLENGLLPQVREILEKATGSNEPRVLDALEAEVFADLYTFFRRYYKDGDFISLRRYKEGVYAIPYEGEEVKLYWANHDQYYIKSSENFRDYRFKVDDGRTVHLQLVDACTETANNKSVEGQERRFILADEVISVDDDTGQLIIPFEYRVPNEKGARQAALNEQAAAYILTYGPDDWIRALASPRPTDRNAKRTLLEQHLSTYTARNTFDYFVHKDLAAFLGRELDFFIKSELLHLDDLTVSTAATLSRISAARTVGHKIIRFLAQVEDAELATWLRFKSCRASTWLVGVDLLDDQLLLEAMANPTQRDQWRQLVGLESSVGLSALRGHHGLLVDTSLFDSVFETRVLQSLGGAHEKMTGVLVNADNFQALRYLSGLLAGEVACVYIDPPYNTGSDGFPYKDSFQHSSWLSMMVDRMREALRLLSDDALVAVSIGEEEVSRLKLAFEQEFGFRCVNSVVVRRYDKNLSLQFLDSGLPSLSVGFEYVLVFARGTGTKVNPVYAESSDDRAANGYWKGFHNVADRPTMRYELLGVTPVSGQWKWKEETALEAAENYRIFLEEHAQTSTLEQYWAETGKCLKFIRRNPRGAGQNQGVEHWIPPSDTKLRTSNWTDILASRPVEKTMGVAFPNAKNVDLVRNAVAMCSDDADWVLDFFAGSGTTAEAVLSLNRATQGTRRFVLVESGSYFNGALKPRVIKSVFSDTWSNGHPTGSGLAGQLIRCLTLESHDEALERLDIPASLQGRLESMSSAAAEEYFLDSWISDERGAAPPAAGDVSHDCLRTGKLPTFMDRVGLRVSSIGASDGVVVVLGEADGRRTAVVWRSADDTNDAVAAEYLLSCAAGQSWSRVDLVYVEGPSCLDSYLQGTHVVEIDAAINHLDRGEL